MCGRTAWVQRVGRRIIARSHLPLRTVFKLLLKLDEIPGLLWTQRVVVIIAEVQDPFMRVDLHHRLEFGASSICVCCF